MKQNSICILASLLLAASPAVAATPGGIPAGGQKFPEVRMPDRSMTTLTGAEDLPGAGTGTQLREAMKVRGKMPSRLKESENYLVGYNWLTTYGMSRGLYRFNTIGTMDLMYQTKFDLNRYNLNAAWVRDGKLCSLYCLSVFEIEDYVYTESDPLTGEIFKEQKISLKDPVTGKDNFLPYYIACTYDPTDDTLWGYTSNKAGSGYSFFTAKADDLQNTVAVVEKEDWDHVCASICYNGEENAMFGINRSNDFVRINRDGTQDVIMPLGVRTEYSRCGIFYDATDRCYYWNARLTDDTSALYCIDAERQTVTPVIDFDHRVNFPYLDIVMAAGDPSPLNKPIIDRVDFGKGDNSGVITVFMPESLFTGQPVSGDLEWSAYIDGEEYDYGNARTGERVAVEFFDITDGFHTFSFDVTLEDGRKSTQVSKTLFIGYDTPNTPENVTISETTISWDPVSRGLNRGYLDMENLTYHVYINDEEVGTVVNTNSFVYTSDPDAPYAAYFATVMAENNGHMSKMSEKSDLITFGTPWKCDIHVTPTQTQGNAFTALDLNGDKYTWSYVNIQDIAPMMRDPMARASGNDDWLFTPPLDLDDPSCGYRLSLDIANLSPHYRGLSVQIYLCDALNPDNVIEKLIDYEPADTDFHRVEQMFNIKDPGVYYIAFHVKHDKPYARGISFKEMDIEKTDVTIPLPAAVTGLSAEGAARGALEAIVNFSMPTEYLNGESIPADEDVSVEITAAETTTMTGKPGQKMQTVVKTIQGNNEIRITSITGDVKGRSAIINVYCGVDVPGPAMNVAATMSEDNLSMHLTWDRPIEVGENGYYVDPMAVEYVIMRNTSDAGWIEYDRVDKDTFEYTFSVEANNGLKSEWLGIAPANEAGRATTYAWMSDMMGTPYPLPVEETYDGNVPNVTPLRIIRTWDEQRVTDWGMVNSQSITGSDEHGVAFAGNTSAVPVTGCMMLPKFSTEGVEDAGMTIDVWTGASAAEVMLLGEVCDATELVQLASFPKGDGWLKHKFRFPENFQNRKWITIFIVANYRKTSDYTIIGGYSLDGGYKEDGVEGIGREAAPFIAGSEMLRVYGHAGQTVRVYSLDGSLVREIRDVPALLEAPLAPGLYVVTAGTDSAKVIIR